MAWPYQDNSPNYDDQNPQRRTSNIGLYNRRNAAGQFDYPYSYLGMPNPYSNGSPQSLPPPVPNNSRRENYTYQYAGMPDPSQGGPAQNSPPYLQNGSGYFKTNIDGSRVYYQSPPDYNQNVAASQNDSAPPTLAMPEGALPFAWANRPSWTWSPGGRDAFYGIPDKELDAAAYAMNAQLPWAQMYYTNQARAFEEDMLRRQFDATRQDAGFNQNFQMQDFARQGDQFDRQFGASREDAAFNRWLQSQDFARQGDQFNRQFDASRDDAMWDRGFQDRQFNAQNSQFDRQFNASRDDAMWGRGFQDRQFNAQNEQWNKEFDLQSRDWERQGNQWNRQFDASREDANWNRGFQERDWNRSGQQWQDQFTQQSNQWRDEFNFQKKNAEEQNRLAEQAQYVGAFGRRFAPAVGSM